MPSSNHIIKRQVIEVEVSSVENAWNIQNRISELYKYELVRVLEEVFSGIADSTEILRIDKLELDLGNIKSDALEEEIVSKLRTQLQEKLSEIKQQTISGAVNSPTEEKVVNARNVRFTNSDFLVHFLRTGTAPWWYTKENFGTVSSVIDQLMEKRPDWITTRLKPLLSKTDIRHRLVSHLDDVQLTKFIGLFESPISIYAGKIISPLIDQIRKLNSKSGFTAIAFRSLFWDALILKVVQDKQSELQDLFSRNEVVRASKTVAGKITEVKEFAHAAELESLLMILERTGKKALKKSGKIVRKKSANQKDVIPENEIGEEHTGELDEDESFEDDTENFTDSVSDENSNSNSRNNAQAKTSDESNAELADEQLELNADGAKKSSSKRKLKRVLRKKIKGKNKGQDSLSEKNTGEENEFENDRIQSDETDFDETDETELELTDDQSLDETDQEFFEKSEEKQNLKSGKKSADQKDRKNPEGNDESDDDEIHSKKTDSTDKDDLTEAGKKSEKKSGDSAEEKEIQKQKEAVEEKEIQKRKAIAEQKELQQQKELREQKEKAETELAKKQEEEDEYEYVLVDEDFTDFTIDNAGLVLLWPFLNVFFTELGLVEDKNFVDEESSSRAVHLLQYLAAGGSLEYEEHELVLNKILCGLDVTTPVDMDFEITAKEKEEAENLLHAVVTNWKAIGNTSIDGLRITFLQKEGALKKNENGWNIQIERKTVDMLLDRLPWGISMIKLPWNTEMIYVEW